MRFCWRRRPRLESMDSRCLLSSSIFSGLPGASLFSNLFGSKTTPPSVIEGQATAGGLPGEIDLVAGYGRLHPLGLVSVPGTTMPSYVFDVAPQGSTGYIPVTNSHGVYIASVSFSAPQGATLSGTPQVLKYVETRYIRHGAGVHQETVTRKVDSGKATLSFPNGMPVPGGPAVHFNLVLTSLGKN